MNHILYAVGEVAEVIHAQAFLEQPEARIKTLLTDSRKIVDPQNSLFFALKGRRDGHEFIGDAYKAGVRNMVISVPELDRLQFPDCNFLLVEDTLKALQGLAAYHRSKFSYPVIGITGSNGKTIVKEWLYQLLAPESNIIRSPKSFNSQLGVPLSVWEMNGEHDLAIIEAGISREGEMDSLESVIKPTIGILTNIGEAHKEGFSSTDEKIAEKLKLFRDTELLIYGCKYLENYTGDIPGKDLFSWCYRNKADLEVFDDEVLEDQYQYLRASFKGREVQCVIPFTDPASVENAIICWATMLAMGYEPEEIDKRMEKLQPVHMRLELKTGINNCSIIDDSYSCDISSLAIALDFLRQQNQHLRRTLILSDIPGTDDQDALYERVSQLLATRSVDRLIGVGERIAAQSGQFAVETHFFDTTEDLLAELDTLKLSNETILIKGARVFEFERVSKALTQKVHETVLEINLNALEHNLNFYKGLLSPGVRIMAMVKAFSYGSGSFEIANLLQFNKVDYLTVAYADEGVALRQAGITLPVMVMNPDVVAFDTMIQHNLEPEVYSFRILGQLEECLNRKNLTHYPIHIKLDTGMHRLGFTAGEVDELIERLTGTEAMRVRTVFSHLVGSDDSAHDEYTRRQLQEFDECTQKLKEALSYPVIRHVSNTSAVSRWPEAQFDMVRLGIGLYGIDPVYEKASSPLQTVSTLKTSISQIHDLMPGESVGYSRAGKLESGGRIATVKIGYADGYSRAL
ncbi:MAG TPA: bifunctional UDP-N-acetylmuramoyl-tripeptide:D-alanyl-D-alanine ligase/alanine racemase, partial [Sphingobacteriaceae bacterium]